MNRLHLTYLLLFFYSLIISSLSLAQKIDRQGKDFALFFAVKDYEEWKSLRNPINDAQTIAKDLEDIYGFQCEVLKNPSQADIYEKLREYGQKNYASDAQLMIFFTGHGEFDELSKEGFFIPRNGKKNDPFQNSYIPHTRLDRIIDNIPCQHILLSIDACYSGTFSRDIALEKSDERGKLPNKNMRKTFVDLSLKYKSRLFFTSGGKERTPDGANSHSPFTEAFLKALRSFGGETGILTYSAVYSYLETVHPRPRGGAFGDNQVGSNFLFIAKDLVGDMSTSTNPNPNPGNSKGKPDLPEMVFVQGGTFQMGSNDGFYQEKPVHPVTLSDFYISKYEVSNAEYAAFLNAKGNQTEGGVEWIQLDGKYGNEKCRIQKRGNRFVVEAGYENHPVIYVSWYGARAYCQWAGGQLPSEAQWEYAARGGQKSKGYRYAGSNRVGEVAVYNANSGGKIQRRGSKAPNELGLYDMSGNVWEWCQDAYDVDFYKSELARRPNPVNNIATSKYWLVRGGSWFDVAYDCRVSYRGFNGPDYRYGNDGFRLSRASD